MSRVTKKIKGANNYCKYEVKNATYKELFYLDSNKEIEDWVDCDLTLAIDKLGELENLEEQIGCPLEVRCNVFYNSTIYNCLGYKMTVKETYDDHFIAVIENDIFSFDYKDYKKTWWLKENKEE